MLCRKGRDRSTSEPSSLVFSSNYTRERTRKTDIDYERGKDKLAHWIGAWGQDEVARAAMRLPSLHCALDAGLCFTPVPCNKMSSQSNGILVDSTFQLG